MSANPNVSNLISRTSMVLFAFLVMLGSSAQILAADTTYRDPRQPSFTLLVPDGWNAESNEQGVVVRRDKSYFLLRVSGGSMPPGAVLVQVRPQFEQQWQQFRELESGTSQFGGQNASYAVYAGVPPSGISSITKIVAMTNGKLSYMAFEGMPAALASQDKPELERIERSFTPDPF